MPKPVLTQGYICLAGSSRKNGYPVFFHVTLSSILIYSLQTLAFCKAWTGTKWVLLKLQHSTLSTFLLYRSSAAELNVAIGSETAVCIACRITESLLSVPLSSPQFYQLPVVRVEAKTSTQHQLHPILTVRHKVHKKISQKYKVCSWGQSCMRDSFS